MMADGGRHERSVEQLVLLLDLGGRLKWALEPSHWRQIVALAYSAGFPCPPDDPEFALPPQEATGIAAMAFAAAIRHVLPDVPRIRTDEAQAVANAWTAGVHTGPTPTPFDYFSGPERRQELRELSTWLDGCVGFRLVATCDPELIRLYVRDIRRMSRG